MATLLKEVSKEISKRPRNKLVPRLQEASRGFKEASKRLQEAPRGFKMHHIAILGLARGLTFAIQGLQASGAGFYDRGELLR